MAELTDEEKAKEMAKEVEGVKPDEAKAPSEEPTNQGEEAPAEPEEEAKKPATPEEEAPTFTKQFQNLKGDNWEEYGPELEKAYQNSTSEALKMKKELEDNAAIVARAKALVDDGAKATPEDKAQFDINTLPEIQMLRAEQQSKMVEAFDTFAKTYPQAKDTDGFDQFQKASAGASQAFVAAYGRVPTYPELFEATANLLKWQPSDKNARKDAALKEAGSEGNTTNSAPKQSPKTNVTEAQLAAAKRFFPNKSDSELVKELSETLQT